MNKIGTITQWNEQIDLYQTTYADNGRIAIVAKDSEFAPHATLTVNLPDMPLEPGEFFVKDWSENEEFAAICLESGLFLDTGKAVPTGFVFAEIWTLSNTEEN